MVAGVEGVERDGPSPPPPAGGGGAPDTKGGDAAASAQFVTVRSTSTDEEDDATLKSLGYAPQLTRDFRLLTSFAISFTIVSVLTGLTGLYGLGYTYGGPVAIVWGWLVCCLFTTAIAAALAELCSAYPAAGGVYFWSWSVAPPKWRALAAWLTLWLNLIGLVGVEAGINFTFAITLQATLQMATGFVASPGVLFAIYAGVTIVHAIINTLPIHYIGVMNRVSIFWHIAATVAFCVALPAVAPRHQSAAFVFTKFRPCPDLTGITDPGYSLLLSLLMSQFTLTGYEASAKVSEESKKASRTAPWAIVLTVVTSGVVGWAYLLAATWSIQDPATLLDPGNITGGGNVFAQILYDASVARFGDARAAIALLCIILPAQFFCGASCLTDAGRALFAFARDRAVPFPGTVAWVHPRTRVPVVACWLMAAATLIIAVPMLGSLQAFTAVTSIATIGTYLSYCAPIALRLVSALSGHDTFRPGPVSLGAWSLPVCAVAALWGAFITVLFVLPTVQPVSAATLNYAGPLAGGVLLFALVWWALNARKWFDGPLTPQLLEERSAQRAAAAQGLEARGPGGEAAGEAKAAC